MLRPTELFGAVFGKTTENCQSGHTGSAASQRSMSTRCGSSIVGIFMRFLYGLPMFVIRAGRLAAAVSLPAPVADGRAKLRLISASRPTGSSVHSKTPFEGGAQLRMRLFGLRMG